MHLVLAICAYVDSLRHATYSLVSPQKPPRTTLEGHRHPFIQVETYIDEGNVVTFSSMSAEFALKKGYFRTDATTKTALQLAAQDYSILKFSRDCILLAPQYVDARHVASSVAAPHLLHSSSVAL